MKLAIDARSMGSRPSGIGMYLYNFLRGLIEDKELELVLFTDVAASEHIKYYMERGVEVRCFGGAVNVSARVYSYFRFIKRQLKELKPDMFWEPNEIIPIKLNGDYRIMITVHDTFPLDYEKYFGKLYKMYFKISMKKTLRMADRIVYNSNQSKLSLQKHFDEAKNIASYISYIVIDNDFYEEQAAASISLPEDYFLYVGNLERRKGSDILIAAYQKYIEAGGKRSLVIAGKLQESDVADELYAALRKTDSLIYLDYVTDKDKQALYKNCACFVFPSMAEGFGMPVVEAMKYKKAILVRNLDIYDEITGDCICRYNGGGDEAASLAKAMLRLEQQSYEPQLQKYAGVMERYSQERLVPGLTEFIKM